MRNRGFTPLEVGQDPSRRPHVQGRTFEMPAAAAARKNKHGVFAPRPLTGFTLIETVVIVAMYAVILVALANLFTTFSRLYRYQQSFISASQAAGASIASIHAAVIPASQVLASYNFASGALSSATSTLVLEIPAANASGQVIAGVFDHVAFYTSGTSLYRVAEAGAGSVRPAGKKLLTSSASSVSFTYDNLDFTKVTSVTVDLVASSTASGAEMTTHRHEKLYLRN